VYRYIHTQKWLNMDWYACLILLLFIISAYDMQSACETQDWHEQMNLRFNLKKVSSMINIAPKIIKVWVVHLSSEFIGTTIHRAAYFKKIVQWTCRKLTTNLQRKPCSQNSIILPAIWPFFTACCEILQVPWIHPTLIKKKTKQKKKKNQPKKTAAINLWLTMNLKQTVETIRCFWMSVVYDRRSLTGNPYNCQDPKAAKQKTEVLLSTFKLIHVTVSLWNEEQKWKHSYSLLKVITVLYPAVFT